MKSSWWYRFTLFVFLFLLALATITPTILNLDKDSRFPFHSKINLGLDLQGGLYMILGIDFSRVYRDEIKQYGRKIEQFLADQEIKVELGEVDTSSKFDPKQTVVVIDAAQSEQAQKKIQEYFGQVLRPTHIDGNKLQYGIGEGIKFQLEQQSVTKSIEVIRNRIDEFGVTEPEITSQGKDRIVVQLPGVKDIDRAKDLIGKTAKLEFRLVNDQIPRTTIDGWLAKAEQAQVVYQEGMRFSDYLGNLNTFLKDDLPKGHELAFEKTISKKTNALTEKIPYLLETTARLTGDDLQDANVDVDQQKNQPYVSMVFKSQGARLFEEVTGDNVGKRLAVLLDGNVYTAPVINGKIPGGRAQITLGSGSYDKIMKEARDIALVLRAGALPVALDFLEQRIVGPSLGHDSIAMGINSGLLGVLIVFIFVIFYYRIAGVIAVFTLGVNVVLVVACLIGFEATLTLPGIAGIALTVGMAVDASIIIFERIRGELRSGLSNYKAVELGFENAFWTILDANITTALAGIALINFGTGPIRGFAVTLLIGIFVTVYTGYYLGKLFFEWYMAKVAGQKLSI